MTKALVITGAAGGIGSAIALRAASEGYTLFLMDRDSDALAGIAEETGGTALAVDITDPSAVERAFGAVRASARALYGLVLAAGIVDNAKLSDLDPARWQDVLVTNLTGPFLCCLAAQGDLIDGGRIVTLGSLAGRTGGVITGTAYGRVQRWGRSVDQVHGPGTGAARHYSELCRTGRSGNADAGRASARAQGRDVGGHPAETHGAAVRDCCGCVFFAVRRICFYHRCGAGGERRAEDGLR